MTVAVLFVAQMVSKGAPPWFEPGYLVEGVADGSFASHPRPKSRVRGWENEEGRKNRRTWGHCAVAAQEGVNCLSQVHAGPRVGGGGR